MEIFKDIKCSIKYNELLKNHTTFGIGGKCIALIEPNTDEDILDVLKICKENNIKYFLIGNGSNLLVKDSGYNGIIIKLKENFNNIIVDENRIISQSGATLKEVFDVSLNNSLSGFEFASGIPGTIGGAVYMNAGAYGGEMKEVVEYIEVIDPQNLKIFKLENKDLGFGYRKSVIQKNNYIVTKVSILLKDGVYEEIKSIYEDLNEKRNTKQPLNYKSGGSTFKRPEGHFAAKLIEDSGLKGYKINDAMVSEKHAGFVINLNNATYDDVINVVNHVKKVVFEKYGVNLEMEVKILGD